MTDLAELLAPISDDNPAGPDLSDGDDYAEIETAYRDADPRPGLSPAGSDDAEANEEEMTWADVLALTTDFLTGESKDTKVAVFHASAWLRDEGLKGLGDGLEMLCELFERYWDDMHPEPEDRAFILDWLGGRAGRSPEPYLRVSYAAFLAAATNDRHSFLHYRDWRRHEDKKAAAAKAGDPAPEPLEPPDDAGQPSAASFGAGFDGTAWEWYRDLRDAAGRAKSQLDRLISICKERYDGKGPHFGPLVDALDKIADAASDLFARKPVPEGAEQTVFEDEADDDQGASGAAGGGGGTTVVRTAEPQTVDEAGAAIKAAARLLRRENPGDPAPYLLIRGFRWGEIRGFDEDSDGRDLARALHAPTTQQRTSLKSLYLEERWEDLLEASESIAAEPTGRGWLDLQRYSIVAADRLGPQYEAVARALRSALREHLAAMPELVDGTLMDDLPTTSRGTREWLETAGLLGEGPAPSEDEDDGSADTDEGLGIRRATFARAHTLVRNGDPHAAIELLIERAEREVSERARFITKCEAAAIMVAHGMGPVARPTLEELRGLIERHGLEEWETPEVVGKALATLYRCLEDHEDADRQQIYARLAKLDPMMAMSLQRFAGGPAAPDPPAPETELQTGQDEADG